MNHSSIRFYSALTALLLIISLTTIGCDHESEAWKNMNHAEDIMETSPDSALYILESIQPEKLYNNKEKARLALLRSMALDKNYIDTATFEILQPAIDYYTDKGTPDEKLRTYYYQGRIYQNKGDDNSAMNSFIHGREYYNQCHDTLTMANLLVAQAAILYTTYKFEDFINNNLIAAKLYETISKVDYEVSCLENALDGCIITNNRQLSDSIIPLIHQRIDNNDELKPTFEPYLLSYAVNWGDYNEILSIISSHASIQDLDDVAKIDLAEAYCKIEDYSNALRILNSIPVTSEAKSSMKYLATSSYILEKNGDYSQALKTYQNLANKIDSIHMNIFSHDLLFAKERHEIEKTNMLKIQKRDNIIWLCLCSTCILLIITLCSFYRYRLSKAKNLFEMLENERLLLEQEKLKKDNENLELKNYQSELERNNLKQYNERLKLEKHTAVLEKQTAELEYERQSLEAENLRLNIEQLEFESASLKEILDKQKFLSKPIEDAIKIRIEMLNSLLASEITKNTAYSKPYGNWIDKLIQDKYEFMNTTRLAFKASHPKFIEYLEKCSLTESEINYVCLYAIGLRGKEAGEYIQLKRHYHISSAIRNKLGINEHQTNLGIYIRKLMKQ